MRKTRSKKSNFEETKTILQKNEKSFFSKGRSPTSWPQDCALVLPKNHLEKQCWGREWLTNIWSGNKSIENKGTFERALAKCWRHGNEQIESHEAAHHKISPPKIQQEKNENPSGQAPENTNFQEIAKTKSIFRKIMKNHNKIKKVRQKWIQFFTIFALGLKNLQKCVETMYFFRNLIQKHHKMQKKNTKMHKFCTELGQNGYLKNTKEMAKSQWVFLSCCPTKKTP